MRNILYKHGRLLLAVLGLLLLCTACTPGNERFTADAPAGFWMGLWHGAISMISLIVHIFNRSVHMYELHNTGAWYDFGFLMGAVSVWGGGTKASCVYKSKKKC